MYSMSMPMASLLLYKPLSGSAERLRRPDLGLVTALVGWLVGQQAATDLKHTKLSEAHHSSWSAHLVSPRINMIMALPFMER